MSPSGNHRFVELRTRKFKIRAHRDRCRSLPPLKKGDSERLVAEFIERRNGVTKCPVAYLVPLSGNEES